MTTIKFLNLNPHTMPEPSLEHPDYYPIQRRPYVDEDGNIWRNIPSRRRTSMAHTPSPDSDDVMLSKVLYELEASAVRDWEGSSPSEISAEFAFIAKMIHDYRSDNL